MSISYLTKLYYIYVYIKTVIMSYITKKDTFNIKNNVIIITGTRLGKQYSICSPFKLSTFEHKAYVLYSNGNKIDITQPPGVKYTVRPSDFGKVKIIIEYSNNTTDIFENNSEIILRNSTVVDDE